MVYNDFVLIKAAAMTKTVACRAQSSESGQCEPDRKDGRGRSLQSFWAENSKPGRVTHVMVFRVAGSLSLS